MLKIIGHVIALTKSIWLIEPTSERGAKAQFMAGKRKRDIFTGGFVITWWYTKSSFKAIEAIASMIVETLQEFKDCDLASVEEVIKITLTEICVEKAIFNGDDVCFSRRQTLFECRSCADINQFGSLILNAVIKNLNNQLTTWCTVYAAPRISGPSFSIPNSGLSVISRSDTKAWEEILRKGYLTDNWNPIAGNSFTEKTVFSSLKYDYVFVCEDSGTQKGAKFASMLKLRRLFSIIFALVTAQSTVTLSKSGGDPYSICLQFPGLKISDASITMSSIGELVPYYLNDHVLTTTDIIKIQAWFAAIESLRIADVSRVEKCAHFINKAMNSDDIESYINYFVALDALFGERGSVESSILAGVESLELEDSMKERASWLFDLRNELVHGGSRYIKEWPKYDRYYRHFDTKPEQDIQKLAFTALLQGPVALPKLIKN